MNSRGFYIAAALLLAAIGLFYFFDLRKPAPSVTASPKASPIVTIDPASVTEIDVKSAGKVLTVTRSGNEWRYSVCPADQATCASHPADTVRSVQLLVVILQLRPIKTVFGAPEGLPAYGLATGTGGEVTLKSPGRSVTLLVGATAPGSAGMYVRLSDSNDIQVVALSSMQTQVLGAVNAPPVPVPSPSPGAAGGTLPSPSAGIIGPGPPSP
jgi:hypothetical protein